VSIKTKTKGKRFLRFAKGVKSFFFEVLIVVIAVSFSFLLNEWRIEQGEKVEEKEILAQVLEDLKADSAKIRLDSTQIQRLTERSVKLIKLTKDSIGNNFIDKYKQARSVVVYVPFQASKAGYFELSTQGNASKIRNKQLLMQIMELYEGDYNQLIELNIAHKNFLINKVNMYATENFPHIGSLEDTKSKEKREKFINALVTDEFKHLLEFDIILKQNILFSYTKVLETQDSLIKIITPLVE